MAEQLARVGDLEIVYEEFGNPENPAMLLIMGLATQMVGWDEELCEMLASRGFRVVRFDNRDVGRSTILSHLGPADIGAAAAGDYSSAGYTLSDMAADAVGLLDVLGVGAAHVVGASQGGMIAQTIAIEHPERVLSLTSIMSTTGDRAVGQPHPEGLQALLTPAPRDREGYGEYAARTFEVIGSGALPDRESERERIRQRALVSFDRGYHPDGVGRQLLAILASGSRAERLGEIAVPTLVIHGTADPLVDVSGGKATAAAIPDARLELVEGMGHDLPKPLWPRFVELIAENAARAKTPNPA